MVEAFLNGRIVTEYPDDQRVLISGRADLLENLTIYLHLVCECADSVYIEFITAYVPDEQQWEWPPFRRRKRKRK
jgi:hypothetical protein